MQVQFKPSVSGAYSIAISLFGVCLPGSPFALTVYTPQPDVAKCELRGDALTAAISRTAHSFEVRFKDSLGQVAHAEELSRAADEAELLAVRWVPQTRNS